MQSMCDHFSSPTPFVDEKRANGGRFELGMRDSVFASNQANLHQPSRVNELKPVVLCHEAAKIDLTPTPVHVTSSLYGRSFIFSGQTKSGSSFCYNHISGESERVSVFNYSTFTHSCCLFIIGPSVFKERFQYLNN